MIIIKNLTTKVDTDELKRMFARHGPVKRILMPPGKLKNSLQRELSIKSFFFFHEGNKFFNLRSLLLVFVMVILISSGILQLSVVAFSDVFISTEAVLRHAITNSRN